MKFCYKQTQVEFTLIVSYHNTLYASLRPRAKCIVLPHKEPTAGCESCHPPVELQAFCQLIDYFKDIFFGFSFNESKHKSA